MTDTACEDRPQRENTPERISGAVTTFADALKAMREARGLTQYRLAQHSGHNHATISRYEGGSRNPTREAITLIADALDATDDERTRLLESAGFAAVHDPEVEAFRALPDDVRALLIEMGDRMTRGRVA